MDRLVYPLHSYRLHSDKTFDSMYMRKANKRVPLLFVLILVCATSLERLDLLRDVLFALVVGETDRAVFCRFRFPVLALVSGLEGWVFTDGGESIRVDFFDVFGTNAIGKVRREDLFESR